jgi:hypothetical protein
MDEGEGSQGQSQSQGQGQGQNLNPKSCQYHFIEFLDTGVIYHRKRFNLSNDKDFTDYIKAEGYDPDTYPYEQRDSTMVLGLIAILAAFVIVTTVEQATPQVAFANQPLGSPHNKCHCKDGAGHHH